MKTHATEVPAKARRRRSTTEREQKILREAEHCGKPGEIGAWLRREEILVELQKSDVHPGGTSTRE